MIDSKFLRSDIQEVAEKLLTKNFQLDCESFNLLDSERKSLQSKLEKLLQERNSHAKKIGMKITENGPADNSVKELKIIGEDLKNQSNQIGGLFCKIAYFEDDVEVESELGNLVI